MKAESVTSRSRQKLFDKTCGKNMAIIPIPTPAVSASLSRNTNDHLAVERRCDTRAAERAHRGRRSQRVQAGGERDVLICHRQTLARIETTPPCAGQVNFRPRVQVPLAI